MTDELRERKQGRLTSALILGIGVILVSVVHFLDELPGFDHSSFLGFAKNLWPVILILMGAARLRRGEEGRNSRGWVLIVAGTGLLMMTVGGADLDDLIGPAIFLGIGIFIVLRTLRKQRRVHGPVPQSADYLRATAVLSGFKNRVHSQAFQGGELTAIFGGFELDLRTARLSGQAARIDVFLMFGGGEIRVPEGWDVTVEATAVVGGVADKTVMVLPEAGTRPRLVLSGVVLFGGIEVKP